MYFNFDNLDNSLEFGKCREFAEIAMSLTANTMAVVMIRRFVFKARFYQLVLLFVDTKESSKLI